ncbi:VWA domain-containing protein [Bacteroidia bacterium]|nr:VWA domain-containing protein [Bacteroidia bacterium]MDC1395186.1 VWA domain-containing protein [Bacteroidia bacterium]
MARYNKIWAILLLFLAVNTYAQSPKTRILFVLDGSGSMYAKMGSDNRITVAKRLLSRMVDSLQYQNELELALRVYGHQSQKTERNCKDTKLEVPFSPRNHQAIKDEIKDLRPKGTTLIAYSLQEAAYDFPKTPGVRNIIILITDGIEECDGDPCAVSLALQKQGVVLRPFVIGLGLTAEFRSQFECVGRYFEAETEADFENVLNVVINQAINNTSAQVNLLDAYGRPTETDVNMTFTDSRTGVVISNIVHTLNYRGLPDTMYLDPSYSYDLKAHTIPPIYKKNIKLTAGIHNTIAIDAPQGFLKLKIDGVTNYKNLQALIMDKRTNEILNVQDFNSQQKYLINDYKIELLTLPRITQESVAVHQNKTTTLQVQQPGKLNIITRNKLIIGVYRIQNGELEMVKNLKLNTNQNITVIQPGDYKLIYRESSIKESNSTKTLDFSIKSGIMTHLNIK